MTTNDQIPKHMKNIFRLLLIATIAFNSHFAFAQGIAVNISGLSADSSAILDVSSDIKGFLIPRMKESDKIAIVLPAKGLLIYQYDGVEGFWYNHGDPATPDWRLLGVSLTPGTGISIIGNTISNTGLVTASNGLTETAGDVKLGGALIQNTTVAQGAHTMAFISTATNGFSVDGTTFSVDAANDRIGIGTAAPARTLHVKGTGIALQGADTSCIMNSSLADRQILHIRGKTSLKDGAGINLYGDTDSDAATAGNIRFYTDSTIRICILKDGKVGIGHNNPTEVLDVGGQIRIRGGSPAANKVLMSDDANGAASWANVNGTGLSWSGSTLNSVWTQTGNHIYNNNSGRVGIGTSGAASSKLHVNAGSVRISGSTNTNAETGGMLIYDNTSGTGGGTAKIVERAIVLENINHAGARLVFWEDQYITMRTNRNSSTNVRIELRENVAGNSWYIGEFIGGSPFTDQQDISTWTELINNSHTINIIHESGGVYRNRFGSVLITRRGSNTKSMYQVNWIYNSQDAAGNKEAVFTVKAWYFD